MGNLKTGTPPPVVLQLLELVSYTWPPENTTTTSSWLIRRGNWTTLNVNGELRFYFLRITRHYLCKLNQAVLVFSVYLQGYQPVWSVCCWIQWVNKRVEQAVFQDWPERWSQKNTTWQTERVNTAVVTAMQSTVLSTFFFLSFFFSFFLSFFFFLSFVFFFFSSSLSEDEPSDEEDESW